MNLRSSAHVAIVMAAGCFASPSVSQNPVTAFPNNYKLVLDNKDVSVLRVHYGPHETVGVHDHSAYTTVYIYLNDSGQVLFSHQEAKPFDITRPPTHTGAFRVSPGRIERHTVKNLSDLPSDFVRVEFKRVPIRTLRAEFRGPAPEQPLIPGASVAYRSGPIQIERIICDANSDCALASSTHPSVLIAIQSLTITAGAAPQQLDPAQPAAWIPAGMASSLHNNGTGPAQAVRLTLRGR